MDIKIGQWARVTDYNYADEKIIHNRYFIDRITEIGDDEWVYFLCHEFTEKSDILKTADNLEDLLEINDIVHWEYIAIHQLSERDDDFKEVIQKCQSIIDDEYQINNVKNNIKFSNGKITAIELHENRVIQEVKND